MTKYRVRLQVTDDYWVEAQNEEDARRIVAEHYSNNSLDTLEQDIWSNEVYIFSEEDEEEE